MATLLLTIDAISHAEKWQVPQCNNRSYFFYYILFISFIKIWNVQHKILQNQNSKTLGQQGAESPQIISPYPWRLFLTDLQLSFTLLWMARNLQKLQSWNLNMLCKQVCSFCSSCLGTSIVKILEKGAILLHFFGSF